MSARPSMMEKFSTFIGLKVSHLVFSETEQVATTLQYRNITAQEAIAAINTALTTDFAKIDI